MLTKLIVKSILELKCVAVYYASAAVVYGRNALTGKYLWPTTTVSNMTAMTYASLNGMFPVYCGSLLKQH